MSSQDMHNINNFIFFQQNINILAWLSWQALLLLHTFVILYIFNDSRLKVEANFITRLQFCWFRGLKTVRFLRMPICVCILFSWIIGGSYEASANDRFLSIFGW